VSRVRSIQVESDRTLNFLILSGVLSEKSATFRDHALAVRRRDDRVYERHRARYSTATHSPNEIQT
jgi:hypothetical protein